jgi:hypothetical protein
VTGSFWLSTVLWDITKLTKNCGTLLLIKLLRITFVTEMRPSLDSGTCSFFCSEF